MGYSKTKECLICRQEFVSFSANGRYCSKACRSRAKMKTAKLRTQGIFDYDFMRTIEKSYQDYQPKELTSSDYFVSYLIPRKSTPHSKPTPVPNLNFKVITEPKTILVLNHKRDEERSSWR